jgi:hypothetical protein
MAKTIDFSRNPLTNVMIDIFESMSVGQTLTFSQLSLKAGEPITSTTGSYRSAIEIARKKRRVTIVGVRGVGCQRLDVDGSSASINGSRKRIHKAAKRASETGANAMLMNMTRDQQMRLTAQLGQIGAIQAMSARPVSNKATVDAATAASMPITNRNNM